MHDLIIRSLQGEATAEEERTLRDWRRQSPETDREYLITARLWSLSAVASPERSRRSTPPDAEVLIRRAEGGGSSGGAGLPSRYSAQPRDWSSRSGRVASWRWSRRALKVAALAVLLIPVGLGLGRLLDDAGPQSVPFAQSEIMTGAGEMTTVTLQDGTSVRLGPRSRLRLSQEGQDQIVHLEGRAFFGVPPDPSRTFIVRTAYGQAAVLGTRFEVRSEEEEFRVMVVEGSVQVSAGDVAAELQEGEMSRSLLGRRPSMSRVADVYSHLDWMGNALVFQGTPLDRALREVERRYGFRSEIEREELSELTVTATFTDQPIQEILLVLCEIIGARCTIEGGVARIGTGSSGEPRSR